MLNSEYDVAYIDLANDDRRHEVPEAINTGERMIPDAQHRDAVVIHCRPDVRNVWLPRLSCVESEPSRLPAVAGYELAETPDRRPASRRLNVVGEELLAGDNQFDVVMSLATYSSISPTRRLCPQRRREYCPSDGLLVVVSIRTSHLQDLRLPS